jgi:hypothetical protein
MWSTIVTAVLSIWHLLPQITVVLKFCTALAGFIITVPLLARRVRRWLRRRNRR